MEICPAQKHFGLVLDSKLIFNEYIKHNLSKVNKATRLLRKFQPVLRRSSLVTSYKTFILSHLSYPDVVSDQSYKSPIRDKLESIQYNVTWAVNGAIRGSFSEKFTRR